MTGVIKVNELQGRSTAKNITVTVGPSTTMPLEKGIVKAWVYFNTQDNPPNPDGSFGVSSLTDNGQEVEVDLTSTMSNVYYCPIAGGGGSTADPTTNPSNRSLSVIVMSTTKVDSEVYTTNNAASECQCHIAVLGDLA